MWDEMLDKSPVALMVFFAGAWIKERATGHKCRDHQDIVERITLVETTQSSMHDDVLEIKQDVKTLIRGTG